jgi:phosphoribosylformylglycinamidine (FGAM) synthase-like enzyme
MTPEEQRQLATKIAGQLRRAERCLAKLHKDLERAQKYLISEGYDASVDEDSVVEPLGGTIKPPGI